MLQMISLIESARGQGRSGKREKTFKFSPLLKNRQKIENLSARHRQLIGIHWENVAP